MFAFKRFATLLGALPDPRLGGGVGGALDRHGLLTGHRRAHRAAALQSVTFALGYMGCVHFIANWTSENIAAEAQGFFQVLQQGFPFAALLEFGWLVGLMGAKAYFIAAAFSCNGRRADLCSRSCSRAQGALSRTRRPSVGTPRLAKRLRANASPQPVGPEHNKKKAPPGRPIGLEVFFF